LWGRNEEIAALYYLLCAERIVLLHSPSGAGKSSLVQAGLIPRLRGSFDVWRPTRVNQEPCVAAAAGRAINRYAHSAILGFEEGIPQGLRRAPAALAGLTLAEYAAGRPKRPDAPPSVVVIFDQFEEVLTVDPLAVAAKQSFFDQLGALLHDPAIWALFLIREDYLAPLSPYADRVPTHLKNRFRVDLLGLAAAREAIVNPAREKGREFPAAGKLVHDLATTKVQQPDGSFVEQTGHCVEPVQLQVVCRRLWDAMPEDDLSIDDEDLARFGNIDMALADYYADAVARIAAGDLGGPRGERAIRDWFGGRLITAGGIRGQVLKGAGESEGLANDVVEQLQAAHLVRAEKRAGATWCELAHDRLIKPVREDNAAWRERHLSAVQRRAALWESQSRPAGLLLAAAELADGEAWAAAHEAELTDVERRYLAESAGAAEAARQEALQVKRIRTLGIAASILACAALAVGGFAGWEWWRAREAVRRTQDLARVNVSAGLLETQPQQAGLVLLDVRGADQAPPTVEALHKALAVLAGKREVETFAVLRHKGSVVAASFSPDGKSVLTASADGTARLWNAATGKPWGSPLGHGEAVNSASFSPDGQRVVTTSADGMARLWSAGDAAAGKKLAEWRPHADERVNSASFSPDGSRIVTASSDKTARLWDTAGKLERKLTGHGKGLLSASFSQTGQVVTASFDRTVRLWAVTSGQPLGEPLVHREIIRSAAFSPDGRQVVTASRDGAARVWDVKTGKLSVEPLRHRAGLRSAAFSPDGRQVVTAADDGTARLWDVETGKEMAILGGHTAAVRSASFSPEGSRIVTASADGTARLWNLRSNALAGEELAVFRGTDSRFTSAAFSPDGRRIVTASAAATTLWDAATGRHGEPLPWPCRRITAAAFSPDGHNLVAVCNDGTVRVRDASTGAEVRRLGAKVPAGSVSPDGTRTVTASEDDAQLRDARTGKLLATLEGHWDKVTAASFSPDGTRILTASADGTVRLWANPSDYTSFLLGRLRARNQGCVDPAVRRDALGETAEDAERDTQACTRCVPVFFARLGQDPESRPESYVEAWRAYRKCREAR
jgi:WD40 repeat protein